MRWSACRHPQRLPQSGIQYGFRGALCLIQCKAVRTSCTPLLPVATCLLTPSYIQPKAFVVFVCRSLVLTVLLGLQQFTMICSALEMAQQKALLQLILAWLVQLPSMPTVLCKPQHSLDKPMHVLPRACTTSYKSIVKKQATAWSPIVLRQIPLSLLSAGRSAGQ